MTITPADIRALAAEEAAAVAAIAKAEEALRAAEEAADAVSARFTAAAKERSAAATAMFPEMKPRDAVRAWMDTDTDTDVTEEAAGTEDTDTDTEEAADTPDPLFTPAEEQELAELTARSAEIAARVNAIYAAAWDRATAATAAATK